MNSGWRRWECCHYTIRRSLGIQVVQLSRGHLLAQHLMHHLVRLNIIPSRSLHHMLLLLPNHVLLTVLENIGISWHQALVLLLVVLSSLHPSLCLFILLIVLLLFFLYHPLLFSSHLPVLLQIPCSGASSCANYWRRKWRDGSNISLVSSTKYNLRLYFAFEISSRTVIDNHPRSHSFWSWKELLERWVHHSMLRSLGAWVVNSSCILSLLMQLTMRLYILLSPFFLIVPLI